jgi:hypothetical protein
VLTRWTAAALAFPIVWLTLTLIATARWAAGMFTNERGLRIHAALLLSDYVHPAHERSLLWLRRASGWR